MVRFSLQVSFFKVTVVFQLLNIAAVRFKILTLVFTMKFPMNLFQYFRMPPLTPLNWPPSQMKHARMKWYRWLRGAQCVHVYIFPLFYIKDGGQ